MKEKGAEQYLKESVQKLLNGMDWMWAAGIILTIITAIGFRIWLGAKAGYIPLLFLLCVAARIYVVNIPIHRMLEIVTISTVIIVLGHNPFVGAVFGLLAFVVSRFFGHAEDPKQTIILAISTVIMAYATPFFAANYSIASLVVIMAGLRAVLVNAILLAIYRQIASFVSETASSLIVSCCLNYALVLLVLKLGWV